MHDLDIAGAFFGRSRDGANTWSGTGLPAGNATTQYAEAVSSSSNGYVTLQIDGVNVGVHTTYAVKSGDTCIVSVANREPVVIGVVGKGDKVDNLVASTIKATTAIVSQVIAGSVSADTLLAVEAYIQSLKAGDFAADSIEATTANVVKLVAKDAKFDSLSATKAVIGTLEAAKAYIEDLTAKNVTAEKLEAATAYVEDLAAGNVTAEKLAAAAAYIGSLTAEDVTAGQIAAGLATIDTLDATYANVDFANVGVADIGELLAKSGIIGDIVTETGTITGRLVGVTIVGDLIEAGTLKADRLVVKGEDGLYYKLNVGAESVEGEQTDYNSINGSSIQAQSITATKISVSDLVAFGATIGGLVIEDGSLHSHAKRSHDSGVNGFFLGSDGSAGFGGEASYLRYYAETDDLEIKAKSVVIDTSAVALAEDAIMGVEVQYALSSSATAPPASGWSATAPAWESGRYMWQRTVTTMADGSERTSAPTCLSGAAGQDGKDGKTYYTWLKYADSPTSGMSDDPSGKAYIGLAYNKTTATESASYSDYTWSLIKGDKGDQGVPGGKGADGKTYYTWVKYATSASGANMSDNPSGKTYIGLAYNKATATESTNASDYTWSLIKGDKGDQGIAGDPGKGVKSTVVAYQASSSGTTAPTGTWAASPPNVPAGQYLWTRMTITYTDNATTVSYSVARQGSDGGDGKDGADGKMLYGACATAANVAAKVASAAGFKLYQGATVAVKFSASNTVTTAITLNVNSTGAKNVYVNGALTSAANRFTWDAGDTVQFVYDGAGYVPLSEGSYVKETASGVEFGKPGAPVKSLVNASGSFDVIDSSGSVLSRFAAKLIELGKNSVNAVIRLCGGKGEIKTETVDGSSTLTVSADSVATRAASADKAAHFLARILNGVPTATMSAYYDGTQSVGVVTATPDGVVMRGGATFYGSTGQYVGDFRVGTVGTASAVGLNRVMVGNDKTKGMDGNAAGALYMYGSGKGFTRIYPSNNTDSNSYLNLSGLAGTGTLPAYKALYSNASGTTGTVALSETAANFSMLEIFFRTNDGDTSSVRVWAPNGKVANLSSSRITAAAGAGWTKSKQISISGTTLAYTGYAGESGIGSNAGGTNYVGSILICYVLGWK